MPLDLNQRSLHMPGFIGFPELLLLGLVVLLVFGPKRLPEMGRSLGRGLKEFKSSVSDHHEGNFTVPQEPVVVITQEPVAPVREREVA
jgi:sec-independent protein translocase protein TatA